MSLIKTRRLLACFLTLSFAAGIITVAAPTIVRFTFCNDRFMGRFINSSAVREELDETYARRITALSKESGVPMQIFITARDEFIKTDNTVTRIYRGYESSLYSTDKVDTVRNFCTEYCEGTGISSTEAELDSVAEKAVIIYNETYALEGTRNAYEFIQMIIALFPKLTSAGLLVTTISLMGLILLYKKRTEINKALISALNATGFSFVLISLFALIFGIGAHAKVLPEIYAGAIASAVRTEFIMLLAVGLLISGTSAYYTPKIYKKKKN